MNDPTTSDPRPVDTATTSSDDVRDTLPDDLNASGYVGPYQFPDNSRRRVPGMIYLSFAVLMLVVWLIGRGDGHALINEGWLWGAVLFAATGALSITSGWRMTVDEKEALVAAQGASVSRLGTPLRSRCGAASAAGRRGAYWSTRPRTRRASAASCSSTQSTRGWSSTSPR